MAERAYWNLAQALVADGQHDRASVVLEQAASEGNLDALLYLAQLKFSVERYDEAAALVAEAEARVSDDDEDTHFKLYLAYACGPAGGDFLQRQGNAFRHLEHVARMGDPRAQASVGLHYWQGLNCVEVDLSRAEHWLSLAAQSGEPDIVRSYRKLLRQRKTTTNNAP